ncbi:slo-interacting protein 1 isoform X2 [Zeugodacus cucurbitae]|uniref:slo-interacting protein 1 isoform X2 n=1 Tax=Zeugodacus cucurbitae TaxID=28588 RepID=UPI00059689B2|nr:slo-interacting protein 1 isoform X2 [Zeugodacus cucurbitae]
MAEIDFVVLKVNGTDINQLPEQKVVQMFLNSGEPLLVEIHRKYSSNADCIGDSNLSKNDCDNISSKMEVLQLSSNEQNTKNVAASSSSTIKLVLAMKPSPPAKSVENYFERVCKTTQTDTSYFLYDSAKEAADHFIEHEHNLLEQCLAPEIDIEEITLRKSDSNERLGLIVCYNNCGSNGNGGEHNGALSSSDDNDACTEVYISGIQPDSVAGRDGRLRQGDQILQINGKDIKNKEETELLIAENNNAVTLLVSRYLFADEDDFNDPLLAELEIDDEDDGEEEEYYVESNMTYENCLPQNEPTSELEKALAGHSESKTKKQQTVFVEQNPTVAATTADTTLPALSSFTQTNVATVNSPEKQLKDIEHLHNHAASQLNIKKDSNSAKKILRPAKTDQIAWRTPTTLAASRIKSNEQKDCNYDTTEHIYETIPEDSESEPVYCSPYESSTYVTALGSCSSAGTDSFQQLQQKKNVVKWLDVCATPMTISENAVKGSVRSTSSCIRKYWNSDTNDTLIRKKNNTVSSILTTITNGSSSSGGSANSGGSNRTDISQDEAHDNSSSAYNTGGSHNSTVQLFSVLNPNYGTNPLSSTAVEEQIKYPLESMVYQTFHKSMCREVISQQQQHEFSQSLKHDKIHHQKNACCPQFVAPNLSQYHFVSSQEVGRGSQLVATVPTLTNADVNQKPHSKDETMVWKVKRRQDGTRYIVRRPARNRCMVRDRSIRINTEHIRNRDMSTTTEEDNVSEVKAGRYWSKEDRKKHVERARERKQQQQLVDGVVVSKICLKDHNSSRPLPQKRNSLNQQYRTNQNRVIEQGSNTMQQSYTTASLQQHYQLQFNSSRIPCQKPSRIVAGCDSNSANGLSSTSYNEMQFMPSKEPALETTEKEISRSSLTDTTPAVNKVNSDVQCRPLVLPGPQAVGFTNTPNVTTSAEGSELQNFISITSI